LFQNFPADLLCIHRKATALVIGESHPPFPDVLSKDTILFDEVSNYLLLMMVHQPATERTRKENGSIPEGIVAA
jgi:hypothetical protein